MHEDDEMQNKVQPSIYQYKKNRGCTMKNELDRAKTMRQGNFYLLITETLAKFAQLQLYFNKCRSVFFHKGH